MQAYVPIPSQGDKVEKRFYKGLQSAGNKAITYCTTLRGDRDEKRRYKKQVSKYAKKNFETHSRKYTRENKLIELAARNSLKVVNTFVCKCKYGKQMWARTTNHTINEIPFIFT